MPAKRKSSVPLLEPKTEAEPFRQRAIVLVTLSAPREKFWGAVLSLSSSGVALLGCELVSFEDCVAMTRSGEGVSLATVFFPMHRVERMELDASSNGLPSLSDRFASATGKAAAELFAGTANPGKPA